MRHLLVDGHNVLLRCLPHRSMEGGAHARLREALIHAVREYGARHGFTCRVAFDGSREHENPWESTRRGDVRVAYSRGGGEADEVLVEWVRGLEGEDVCVVTSDRTLAARTRSLGARVMRAEALFEALDLGGGAGGSGKAGDVAAPPQPQPSREEVDAWVRIFSTHRETDRSRMTMQPRSSSPPPPPDACGPRPPAPSRSPTSPRRSGSSGEAASKPSREAARDKARERYRRKERRRRETGGRGGTRRQ